MEDMKNNVHPDPSETWNDEQVERKEANGSNQDCQEGRQACKEKPEEEIQASYEQKEENREEREASERKAEDPQGQEKGAVDQGKGMEKESVRGTSGEGFSCSYTPPYYVPSFTVVEEKKKKSKQRTWSRAGIAILLTLCLFTTFVAGGMTMLWLGKVPMPTATNTPSDMTVIKNDGSIKVNEKVGSTGYNNLSVSGVVALVAESVVEITTTQVQTDAIIGNYVKSGAGSGVLVDVGGNGYIITNNHVIEGASQIVVRLTDGTEHVAVSLGGDADFDIAVLKINATGLPYATLGSSASLTVGEEVVAIGNPLGELGGTVTNGIISALDRSVTVDGHRMTLLQTNAAINPGNSGGGLFNMAGELIGIVNAKQSETGIEGLGFAIPIDIAWKAAEDIIQYGYVTGKPDYGFDAVVYASDFHLVEGWNRYLYPAGIYVENSRHDSLKEWDRIVSINGVTINSTSDFLNLIDQMTIGDVMEMTVSRRDGTTFKQVVVNIAIEEFVPSET